MYKVSLLIILMLTIFDNNASNITKGYKFGVFPYLPTNRIKKVYTPIANDFEKASGTPVFLRTKSSYNAFKDALSKEEYDIAFIQPYDYILAHDMYNYLPLARRSIPLRTVIIVDKDSKYHQLSDLKGKTIATPAPHAAVSRITDKTLLDKGFDLNTEINRKYKKNHFACMQSVIIGETAACGTAERALKHFSDVKMKTKFRILHKAQEIPNSLFVIHKRVPKETRELLIDSILNWPNTTSGKKILAGGKIIPMIRTKDSAYDVIR